MLEHLVSKKVVIQPDVAFNPIRKISNSEIVEDYVHTVAGQSFVTYGGWCVGYGCTPSGSIIFSDESAPTDLMPSQDTLSILRASRTT